MTIKDIVKITATCLGRENVASYLEKNEEKGDALNQVDVMTRCANLVINELACTFVPMVYREKVNFVDGKFVIENLSHNVIRILKVLDQYGESVHFETSSTSVLSSVDSGYIEYAYIPDNYGLTETIGYQESQVPARVIAFGTAAEFCLTESSFDESVIWHKKYMDALAEFMRPKNFNIKARSWS